MDTAVISERLLELIAGREVKAAVFTTYTFEPEFFEIEVIPLLLNQESAYSSDERVKRFMVRENLRESGLPIDVFYDLPMFRRNGDSSPEMEYICHGVNLRERAFHGKINMILVKDLESNEETLLFGAGSNNLSRAGWWDNIECQHWEEIKNKTVTRRFLKELQEELLYLEGCRSFNSGIQTSAIDQISEYIFGCKSAVSIDPIYYYGLSYTANKNKSKFESFLTHKKSPLQTFSNWNLEIISPFFADDANNTEYKTFFDMGIEEIKLFLPFDDEGNALCQDKYYQHIHNEDRIDWAQWSGDVAGVLGVNGDYFRRLHAKVYHFYNKRQSWIFVGSVNFTYKAFHENAEAGFLVKLRKSGPLLERIPDKKVVESFEPPEDIVPGNVGDYDNDIKYPEIHLVFDWKNKTLIGRTARREVYEIEVIGSEGHIVVDDWKIKFKEEIYQGDTENLQKILRNGSLVKIRGFSYKKKDPFKDHFILLQQTGWSHKPLNLPELSAAQILAIYSGMSSERRQMMLIDAKIRALVLSSQAGELTTHDEDIIVEQFFSEYAEVFNAFNKFKKRLEDALESNELNQVDYYLTGTGVDSLVSLVARANEIDEDNQSLNAVSRYLILLSTLEVYTLAEFSNRPNVADESKKLRSEIELLKNSGQLTLENNSKDNRKRFFQWFEEEFFRVYKVVEKED